MLSVCPTAAYVNLYTNTCDIYSLDGTATEHELAHCKGGDHDGALQRYYNNWKNGNGSTRVANIDRKGAAAENKSSEALEQHGQPCQFPECGHL
jgi:hypothetical protein